MLESDQSFQSKTGALNCGAMAGRAIYFISNELLYILRISGFDGSRELPLYGLTLCL